MAEAEGKRPREGNAPAEGLLVRTGSPPGVWPRATGTTSWKSTPETVEPSPSLYVPVARVCLAMLALFGPL